MPAMMTDETERGVTKEHIRIREDSQDIPPQLPPTQQRNIRFPPRPSSGHNPSTQPLPSLKLRRWRPLSAGGNTTLHSSQAKGNVSGSKVPKPPVKSNQKPAESKSKRELTLSERNYKKSRLMKFTYPTQMHNWVGPQPNEVPNMLKRSVPRCLQRGNYYARLPQRHACHYAPWKSITHVNRHQFTSFSLPHPRNKKEQEALEVKAKNTPRTPRHVVKESDTENDDEATQNVLELAASADDHDDDENVSKNGSYHYVYEESNTNQAKDLNGSDNEDGHSVKSARSEEYEYQEIPTNKKKDVKDTDDYENDFDKEEQDIRNGNRSDDSNESGVNSDIDDDTDNDNNRKSSSRRSSKISKDSSKGRRRSNSSINDDIEDETRSIAAQEQPTSRRSSRVSNHSSRSRRDSSNESIIDEVESTKAKGPTKRRDSIASEDEIVEEDDETTNKSEKLESKGRGSSSEAESVGSDNDEDTKKHKPSRPSSSNKSKSSIRSNVSESDEEKELDTGRKAAVTSRHSSASSKRKRSITSQQNIAESRKNSISKRKSSVSARKSSIVSDGKDSVTSKNSYVASRRSSAASRNEAQQSRKNSIASNRKDFVVSQKSAANGQKDSVSRRSADSDEESKR